MLTSDEVVEAINRVTARHNYLIREHGADTQEHSRLMGAEFGLPFESLMEVLYFSIKTNLAGDNDDPADVINQSPWLPEVMRHCVWMGMALGQRAYELIREQGDDPKDVTITELRERAAIVEDDAADYQVLAKVWKQAAVTHHEHPLELMFCPTCISAGVIEARVATRRDEKRKPDGPDNAGPDGPA